MAGAFAELALVRPFAFLTGDGLISLSDMVAKPISGGKMQSRESHLTYPAFAPIWGGQVVTEIGNEIGKNAPPVDSHRYDSFRLRRH